jgi:hypothetical protein
MPAANPTRPCAAGEGRGYLTLIEVQELDDAPLAADDGAMRSVPDHVDDDLVSAFHAPVSTPTRSDPRRAVEHLGANDMGVLS